MVIKFSDFKNKSEKQTDKRIEQIQKHRLTDKQLEEARIHSCFEMKKQWELICWLLYYREESAQTVNKELDFKYNIANVVIHQHIKYFRKVRKVGNTYIWTSTDEGKEIIDKLVRGY